MLFQKQPHYIKWGFESRLKPPTLNCLLPSDYIKWGFESRLKHFYPIHLVEDYYIKWGFESRLKHLIFLYQNLKIISNGDLRVD